MKDAAPTYVTAEQLRTRYSQPRPPATEPVPFSDLRGTPHGDRAQVWEWERMVTPPRRTRRVRERVRVMYCPEGWHSTSGGPGKPSGDALCSTLLDGHWSGEQGGLDRNTFDAYHDTRPVLWVIRVTRGREARTTRFCDSELPDEYRPATEVEVAESTAWERRSTMRAV